MKYKNLDEACGTNIDMPHEERYKRYIEFLGRDTVEKFIPFSSEEIAKALTSGDERLNTLDIDIWDKAAGCHENRKTGAITPIKSGLCSAVVQKKVESVSFATGVCILKEAAREKHKRERLSEETNVDELRDEIEEYLKGLNVCDNITKAGMQEYLEDFDSWCYGAKIGDAYRIDGIDFTIESVDEDDITATPCEETVSLWMKNFLSEHPVPSEEDLFSEIEEAKGAISNNRFWMKGSEGEDVLMYQQNVADYEEYISELKLLNSKYTSKANS